VINTLLIYQYRRKLCCNWPTLFIWCYISFDSSCTVL